MIQTRNIFQIAFFSIICGVFLLTAGATYADDNEISIADIPAEELPGVKEEMKPFDEGRKCKRIRKTGSNRITRVCTTQAQRDEANSASNEFLREQQIRQERHMIENAAAGAPSPQ
jgi:hypothetical protein